MTKVTAYRLDSYGPPGEPAAPRGGIFRLTDASWELVFGPAGSGVRGGLLGSEIGVEDTGRRRRCRVRVTVAGTQGLTASFVLRAKAGAVRADVRRRHESLDRAAEVIAAAEDGEWWKPADAFAGLGWSRTHSIAGVRSLGGSWEVDGCRPTRLARVLDFGPDGVRLRGWRSRLRLPWGEVASIDVADAATYAGPRPVRSRLRRGGAVLTVTSRSGDDIAFHTPLTSEAEVRAGLGTPVDRLVAPPLVATPVDETDGMAPAASMPIQPSVVPDIFYRSR